MKCFIQYFLLITILIFSLVTQAQVLKKEVEVVRPYEPTLNDAYKINLLPEINDTFRFYPQFKYNVNPPVYEAKFDIRPIKPAKMVNAPLEKYYKSYLKLGLGNYLTSLAEFSFNSLRSEDLAWGIDFDHLSSLSKIKLDNSKKVPASYNYNTLSAYGKKIFKKNAISATTRLSGHKFHYYGYNTELFDTIPEKSETRQIFFNFNTNLNFYSLNTDSDKLSYNFSLDYNFFTDQENNLEHYLSTTYSLSKKINDLYVGANGFVNYDGIFARDTTNSFLLCLSPYISKRNSEWKFIAGINTYFEIGETKTTPNIFPKAELSFNVIDNILEPYIGVNGYVKENTYSKTRQINQYLLPGLTVPNSIIKFDIYAGLKGKLAKYLPYNTGISYKVIDDAILFVNDTTTTLQNRFNYVTDNIQQLSVFGSLSFDYNTPFNFDIYAAYHQYTTNTEAEAWHMPAFELRFNSSYEFKEKLIAKLSLETHSKTKAKDFVNNKTISLKGYADIALEAEYQYSKTISAFLQFHNILGNNYMLWNQYPQQKLLILAGFTYSL